MPPKVSSIKTGPGSDEPFEWTAPDAKDEDGNPLVITVPSLSKLPKPNQFKLLRIQEGDPSGVAGTRYILRNGLGEDVMTLLEEELTGDESDEFMKAWEKHSGTTLGKLRTS